MRWGRRGQTVKIGKNSPGATRFSSAFSATDRRKTAAHGGAAGKRWFRPPSCGAAKESGVYGHRLDHAGWRQSRRATRSNAFVAHFASPRGAVGEIGRWQTANGLVGGTIEDELRSVKCLRPRERPLFVHLWHRTLIPSFENEKQPDCLGQDENCRHLKNN